MLANCYQSMKLVQVHGGPAAGGAAKCGDPRASRLAFGREARRGAAHVALTVESG
jgi:hypothetical protein